jgi:outer membrane lipoprotein-sorting protein
VISRLLTTIALASVALGSAGADRDGLFTQIYNRSVVKQQSMQSIRARFTETTTSSLLTAPIVSHGTVVGAPPARVLMTYVDPEPKTVVIDGDTLTIAWPERHERQQIRIGEVQKRIDQYFTHASIKDLQSMFEIVAMPDQTRRTADRIEMRPKRKQIKQGLERLDLWIDRESSLLVQMRMFFAGGDEKTIALDNITTNVPVTDAMFRVTP